MIEEGQEAPDFELETDDGATLRLSDLRGKQVVLYFYPRDDTPGCTTQARGIRDAWADFGEADAVVFGVSPDTAETHRNFKQKYGLPFTLLADPDHEVAERYGVWVERQHSGKTYMGINRSTFVIGPDGTVEKALYGVKADGHAELVLGALS